MARSNALAHQHSSDGGDPADWTLDEAAIRRIFPDAPADLSTPTSARALRRQHKRQLGLVGRFKNLLKAVLSMFVGVVFMLMATEDNFFSAIAAILAMIFLFGPALLWMMGRAVFDNDFAEAYATARGLDFATNQSLPHRVPLLQKGDSQRWNRVMPGTVGGYEGALAHYTYYTEVENENGGTTNHPNYFTILRFELPEPIAERYPGVSCFQRTRSLGLTKLDNKIFKHEAIALESGEFNKRYSLRAINGQDHVALYELFSPTFIQSLVDSPEPVYWEQREGELVIWKSKHITSAEDLDRFCMGGVHVLERYLQEWQ